MGCGSCVDVATNDPKFGVELGDEVNVEDVSFVHGGGGVRNEWGLLR